LMQQKNSAIFPSDLQKRAECNKNP
jgi:hypothetical protein